MKGIYILLGSNLGDRETILRNALEEIEKHCGSILSTSSFYESAAWGKHEQPDFLNQAIELESELSPLDLLEKLQMIESSMGRERYIKWGERKIDIDILYYGELIRKTDRLVLPHPEIPNRKFTLLPLLEIATDFRHPVNNLTQKQLLDRCPDPLWVRKYKSVVY